MDVYLTVTVEAFAEHVALELETRVLALMVLPSCMANNNEKSSYINIIGSEYYRFRMTCLKSHELIIIRLSYF